MEEEHCYCCCRGEQDLCRRSTVLQLLHRKETQLLRLVRFLTAGLLLLVSMVLAFLLILVFGGRFQSPDCQHIIHADGHSSAISAKQQQLEESENPSALLTADHFTETKYLQWEHVKGNAYLSGGFNYSDGDLVVPRNGNYRVYLQITYENPRDSSCNGVGLRLAHRVYNFKQSYKMDVTLLTSADTVSCNMEKWRKSLYTAAVFYLEANDRLRVSSQHPELIVWTEHQMFFGANLEP